MSTGPDHGPIASEHHEMMNAIARALDDMFNGPNCKSEDKKVWFFLTCGNFHETDRRFNYISNADKLDIRATLHEVLARIEGRLSEEGIA